MLEVLGLDGLLVIAGTTMLGAVAGIPALVAAWRPEDAAADASAVASLDTFRLVFLLGIAATLHYAALCAAARRLRSEHAALADAALRLGEVDLVEPITVRGLCADIAGALELARQRSAERFRRAEDRLYQAQRQVAALESGGEDASEEDAPAAEIRVAGRRADGKLVEVSQRRLVVRVPSGSTADLCAGIEALVVVRSPSDGARVDIPVTTARRVDRQDHVLYTFTVTAPERLVALPLSLTALFDNRRDFRVTPDARAALHAELLVAGAATPVSAHVLDISASGIGLRARCDAALLASWGTRITVRVHFPGRSNPFAARARLRNVSAMPGGCRVGLSFAAESAEELADIQREVGDYVRSRHRELRPATHQLAS